MGNLDFTIIAAIITGVLFPFHTLLTGKKTIQLLEKDPDKLVWVYKITSRALLIMMIIVMISVIIETVPLKSIGLHFIDDPIWVALLIVASAVSFWIISQISIPEYKVESIGRGLAGVQHILPKNKTEYKWALITTFIAGTCEELIFRGFLFWQLSQVMHIALAVLAVNLLFGIAHAATKLNNAIKAFGLGVIFSLAYLLTGSLWLSMLLHIIVDLYAATVSYKFSQLKPQP